MIAITENAEGCVLLLRAQPGARKNAVVGEHAGALKVAVSAPAQDGRANKAIAELLAEIFDLRKNQIELLSGMGGRQKRCLIRGVSKQAISAALAPLLAK
jgi:uncharacterized protein (TIGR00251 family)